MLNMMEFAEIERRTWTRLPVVDRRAILREVLKGTPLAEEVANLAMGRDLVWITTHLGERVGEATAVAMAQMSGGEFN